MEREFPIIPLDIIFDILSRLSVKSLYRFKCVSKKWLALINGPQFIKSHYELSGKSKNQLIIAFYDNAQFLNFRSPNEPIENHNVFLKNNFELICACNGILLLYHGVDKILSLWNPSTRSYRMITNSPINNFSLSLSLHGLGYDSITDEFKIFTAINSPCDPNRAYVLGFRSNSWKKIQDLPYYRGRNISYHGNILTVANGVPYWVTRTDYGSVILYFDPHEETFKNLPIPNIKKYYPDFKLASLGGNLCAIEYHEMEICVWVRKEFCWSRLFIVSRCSYYDFFESRIRDKSHYFFDSSFKPLCFAGEGEGVIVATIAGFLVIYNMTEKRFEKIIDIPLIYERYGFVAASYAESLFFPYK